MLLMVQLPHEACGRQTEKCACSFQREETYRYTMFSLVAATSAQLHDECL